MHLLALLVALRLPVVVAVVIILVSPSAVLHQSMTHNRLHQSLLATAPRHQVVNHATNPRRVVAVLVVKVVARLMVMDLKMISMVHFRILLPHQAVSLVNLLAIQDYLSVVVHQTMTCLQATLLVAI